MAALIAMTAKVDSERGCGRERVLAPLCEMQPSIHQRLCSAVFRLEITRAIALIDLGNRAP
jgi:hypothetical protein